MSIKVRVSDIFQKAVKPLLKRYPSLGQDLLELEQTLFKNPEMGTSLGSNLYKIRLAIKSKGKGKSGGARVITYVETIVYHGAEKGKDTTVDLVTIYDKSDIDAISIAELRTFIKLVRSK